MVDVWFLKSSQVSLLQDLLDSGLCTLWSCDPTRPSTWMHYQRASLLHLLSYEHCGGCCCTHEATEREAADGQNSPTLGKVGAIKLQLSAEQLVDTYAWLDRALQQWLEPMRHS